MTQLGHTGLKISRLGAGLAEMGHLSLADEEVASRLLNAALEGGINFLDTAACYGNSEVLIGRTIAHRRDEYVLATKAGHVTGDYEGEAWAAETILDSIDRSLERMKTDHVDLVQLHSCEVSVLEQGEVIEALQKARQAGKTRFIGYSGDNEAARWAIKSGQFDTLQISFNVVDQDPLKELLPMAKEKGMGVIIKRPIANAVWDSRPGASSSRQTYWQRAQRMQEMGALEAAPEDGIALALGFTLAHDEVDTAIVGTSDPEHMENNIRIAEEVLPLPQGVVKELHRRFERL